MVSLVGGGKEMREIIAEILSIALFLMAIYTKWVLHDTTEAIWLLLLGFLNAFYARFSVRR